MKKHLPFGQVSGNRLAMEEQWLREIGFFAGKQHAALLGNQLVDVPPKPHEIRYKANFVKPAVLRSVAKIMELAPRSAVAPPIGVGSAAARETSRISEGVLRHQYDATDARHQFFLAYLWAACNGTAFLKNTYDPEKGDLERFYHTSPEDKTVIDPAALSPEDRRRRDAELLFDDYAEGEVSCEAVSSFQVYPDTFSRTDLGPCRWVWQLNWLDKDWVAERFGVDPDDIQTEEQTGLLQRWEEALALMTNATNVNFSRGPSADPERVNRCLLAQCWQRRSKQFPKGRYLAIAGQTVLRSADNPYSADKNRWIELPFTKIDWTMMPGRFWGIGLVADLMSPQFRYNASRSRIAEFEHVHGRPPIYVPKDCGIAPGMLTVLPGATYEYNAAQGKPEAGPAPQLPQAVMENASMARGEIAQLSSQSDIEGSKMPGQLRSGQAWSAMQHEQDITLTITTEGLLRAYRDVGRQFLTLAKLFYTGARVAKYRGPSGQWAIVQFQSADLSVDVRILGEPGEIESTYAQDRRVMEYVQAGVLNTQDPKIQTAVLKALRFHTQDELVDDALMHEAQQEEEARRMIANFRLYAIQPYPVLPYEDDDAHMRVLVRQFTNLEEWDKLNSFQQAVLLAHYKLHADQQQKKQMQQIQMLQATQGVASAPGQASQTRARAM